MAAKSRLALFGGSRSPYGSFSGKAAPTLAKRMFSADTFSAKTFACATWRSGSADTSGPDFATAEWTLNDGQAHYAFADEPAHFTFTDSPSHWELT
jgi:hypothetical protein